MENNEKRNYDKNPIVINDRMPEIAYWFFIFIGIIPLGAVVSYMYLVEKEIDLIHLGTSLVIIYIPIIYFLINQVSKNRTITFFGDRVVRKWDEEFLTIYFNNINKIEKTFIDFYDKRQEVSDVVEVFKFIYTPLISLIIHPCLIFIKKVYKTLNKFSNRDFYDTIIIFDKNGKLITIFIETLEQKKEINQYLKDNNFNIINNLSVFYTTSYYFFFNKKDS